MGGKTAVNVGEMKNLIGTFAPPRLVLADPVVLKSLPLRAYLSGFYEVAKHAVLSGPSLLALMEKPAGRLRPGLDGALDTLLVRAAQVKVDIVNRDEQEAGLRRLLNLGHTFGHALEEATGYRRYLHGEAVGWGLLCAARGPVGGLQQLFVENNLHGFHGCSRSTVYSTIDSTVGRS